MDHPPNTDVNNDRGAQEKEEAELKRHKPNPKEDGKRNIVNDSQHPELKMRENEHWKRDCVGKHAKLKPCWEGISGKVKMCVRWHVIGHCFKDSKHTASHVKADEIPNGKLASIKKYIAKCRDSLLGLGPSGARPEKNPPDNHLKKCLPEDQKKESKG